jgi:hypothetical protein
MKKLLLTLALCLATLTQARPAGVLFLAGAPTGCSPGTQASAFFTRVSAASITLDAPHTAMYCNLINGLVANGVFAKLDVLYFFATNAATGTASTLALMNLVSSSFNATNHSATFIADQGFTGVSASTTVYIDTGFTPSTAGGNYTQNSAHASIWSNNNPAQTGNITFGQSNSTSSPTTSTGIYTKFTDGKAYFRINDGATASAGVTNASQLGFFLATRSGASTQNGYINAVDQGIVSVASNSLLTNSMAVLAALNNASIQGGSNIQASAFTIGGSLTSTDVANLMNTLETSRQAVGLP